MKSLLLRTLLLIFSVAHSQSNATPVIGYVSTKDINTNPASKTAANPVTKPTLLIFYLKACGHCQELQKAMQQNPSFVKAIEDQYQVTKIEINTPEGWVIARHWNVTAVPALVINGPGSGANRINGFSTLERLEHQLLQGQSQNAPQTTGVGNSTKRLSAMWLPQNVQTACVTNPHLYSPCLQRVYDADPFCCTNQWDGVCENEYNSFGCTDDIQPVASQTVCINTSAIPLSYTTLGTDLSYQWYSSPTSTTSDGVLISGAQSATYTPPTNTTGTTYYYVKATGSGVDKTSTFAQVIVNPIPQITIIEQPASGSVVCVGSPVSASVSVNGTGPYTYQWYKDGQSLGSAQTSATLVLTDNQTTDTGSYSVVVSKACNSVTSTAFNLTVNAIPTRLYVNASATGINNGLSWADAFTDLQSALTYSCSQSLTEIWVAAGVYKPTSGTARSISFVMKNGVAIYGGFAGNETDLSDRFLTNSGSALQPSSSTLSGDIGTPNSTSDNSFHVISNPPGLTKTAILDGFVITGGASSDAGGGMFNNGSSPTIRNCTFQNNLVSGSSASFGGAIFNNFSDPELINCTFLQNSALGGDQNGGGAIFNNFSNPKFINCAFRNNSALGGDQNGGGAIVNSNSRPQFINCSFENNVASGGISQNVGGAIYNETNSKPQLTNCSFQNNSVSGTLAFSGAMFNLDNVNVVLVNCVLFGNGESNTFFNQNSTIAASYSLFDASATGYSSSPTNLTTTSSPFVSTTSAALNPCSSAINAGLTSATGLTGINTDLLDQDRVIGGTVEMGAIEFTGTQNVALGITAQPATSSVVCTDATVTATLSVTGTSPTYQWYKDGQSLGATQLSATLSLTNTQTADSGSYSVVVTGSCNSVTSNAFSLTVNATPTVSISANPSLNILTGQTATLTASGASSYSWSSGASTTAISVSVAGPYSVTGITTGCAGTATVTLNVNTILPPSITAQPASASSVCEGTSVLVTVGVSGSISGYQWLKGGSPVPNQTTATLSLGNIQMSDAGVYSLSLTGPTGNTTSNGFTLSVNPTPTATITFPNSVTVAGSPVPVVQVTQLSNPVLFQASGGSLYERVIVLDRINGYEVRQKDSNTAGVFPITRLGLFTLTVTGGNGCSRTVQWMVQQQ